MKKASAATLLLLALFAIAAFLRLYRLDGFTVFLADQGRDAIVMKRLITLEHLTAIGPPSSIGGVFLGPFYYYLIAPFLMLFHFNPVGMAYGVALLTIAGIGLSVYLIKRESGNLTAALFLVLVGFSAVNITFARFEWNPNLLMPFAFLTLYCFYRFVTGKSRLLFGALSGFLFALSVQLHHLAFLMVPAMAVYLAIRFYTEKKEVRRMPQVKDWIVTGILFLVGYSPLILFDLKHQFLNTKRLIDLFAGGSLVTRSSSAHTFNNFIETIRQFAAHVFLVDLPAGSILTNAACTAVVFLFIGLYIYLKRQKRLPAFIELNFIMVIVYLLLFTFLNNNRIPHYYASIYYSFFLVLAYLAALIRPRNLLYWTLLILTSSGYIFFQSNRYEFLHKEPNRQIKEAEIIADSIIKTDPQPPYQVVGLPFWETEEHIKYFLEIKGHTPLAADSQEEARQLYVICHEECQPLADPQYQIAAFKNGKIVQSWQIYHVTVYKSIHEKR